MTIKLRELLIEKFRAAYKTEKDVTTSAKAMAKFYKEAERVKQVRHLWILVFLSKDSNGLPFLPFKIVIGQWSLVLV